MSQASTILHVTPDGTLLSSTTVPGVVSFAGLAVHPTTGNIWGAESVGATDFLYELDSGFSVLRKLNTSSLITGNILGLDIDPATGNFLATGSGPTIDDDFVVEFDADVTTILSTLTLDDRNWDSLTSVSIGGTGADRRLFVSSGFTDRIFEFSVPAPQVEVPEPMSITTWFLIALMGTGSLLLRRRALQRA